ncbi:MAG: glycosyltransferase [Candidatus Omnitrophica bacterium]|nr:glycosyltransferase [Candidatus Omnitrophota bacterium]
MLYQSDKISVILLSRGGGVPLINSLASIIVQSYRNLEIFLIIDQVDEEIRQLLLYYRDKIKTIIGQKALSRPRVLNETLKLISGRYFTIITAGDVLEPRSLEQKADFLEKNKSSFAVCSDFNIVDKSGILKDSFFKMANLFNDKEAGNSFEIEKGPRELIQGNFRPFSNSLIRNESYMMHGPFNEDYYEYSDFDLFLKMARNYSLGCINKNLASRFFNVEKAAYYLNENMKVKIFYLFALLESLNHDGRMRKVVKRQIDRNYFYWARYLIKDEKIGQAHEILKGYLNQHSVNPRLLFLFLKTIVFSMIDFSSKKHDYFRIDKLKEDLLKLYL